MTIDDIKYEYNIEEIKDISSFASDMKMKGFFWLLFFVITIKFTQSIKKQQIRSYTIYRDTPTKINQLSSYTVKDSTGKKTLFKLKATYSPELDTVLLISHPDKKMVANLEGVWMDNTFNTTYSIYDKKLHKWVEGYIQKGTGKDVVYATQWQQNYFHTKTIWFTKIIQVFNISTKELVGEIRRRSRWFTSVKFEIKIYSDQCPDAIHFFLGIINDHRYQMSTYAS